jgi:hypothetical protein
MPAIRFTPLDDRTVRALRAGGPDAYGRPPERGVSDGGAPCRACLRDIPEGRPMLTLALRPLPAPQPYAKTSPVFLCAEPCAPWAGWGLPPTLDSPAYMRRGYDARDRIVHGTGGVVPPPGLAARAAALLDDGRVACVHVRSAANGCFQRRIDRA